MLRFGCTIAVAAATLVGDQGLPVTRLAGGSPAQTPATQAPAASPPAVLPVTQLDPGAGAATLDSPRRLTLRFAEPRPIQEIMPLLIEGTPFSLAIDPGVDGAFRGEIRNLTMRDALSTLLTPLDLDFDVRGTVIRVTAHRTETREFDVNLLNVRRALAGSSGDAAGAISTRVPSDDVFAGVADGIHALLSSTGRLHVDARAGLAQVTDFPERLERVAQYLEALQVHSGRQVRLEARLFEVTLANGRAIDWNVVRERLGVPRTAPDAGFAADPDALEAALSAQGDVRVISAPEILALNNEPAIVRAATGGASSMTLTIVPQIASDGIVQLSVSNAWEETAGQRRDGWFRTTPFSRIAEASTVVRVTDGHTVMLAGWLRPAGSEVPAGTPAPSGGRSTLPPVAELVVLFRPTVVTPGTFVSR